MKRIAIGALVTAASNIGKFSDMIARSASAFTNAESIQIDQHDLRELGRIYLLSLHQITDTAKRLELPATIAAAGRCKTAFGRLTGSANISIGKRVLDEIVTNSHQLTISLSDELEKHHTYVVAPREGELIDNGIDLFGLEVVHTFPAIRRDVAEGAQCRAYELWTASVMHMMRVAEVGASALADHLGVARGATWGMTIGKVLDAFNVERRAKGDDDLKQWASETATYLNFVKDAFRNPAMHADMSFDREQAISIYDNTRAFMRILATRFTKLAI